jgi:hypothetical protein
MQQVRIHDIRILEMSEEKTGDLSASERTSRLVVRLGEMVSAGARIEEQTRFAAIVLQRTKQTFTPNAIMIVAGLALFWYNHEPLFAIGAVVAALGWHKKILSGDTVQRLLVKVDETGKVSEREIATS